MANNYLQPVNNHFDFNTGDLEDVDDDIFLNNSRSNSTISGRDSGMEGAVGGRSTNPFDDPQQIYAERRREIESRSLESTQRSLGLLYETEDVGKATAAELAKQREQLENTARQLDEINSTLRFSQRHLNGLKSVFGGLKNYLSGNREVPLTRTPSTQSGVNQFGQNQEPRETSANISKSPPPMSPTERYDDHPISRIRDDSTAIKQREQIQAQRSNNPFQTQLESNLDEMCDNLSRLKFLATDLGSEIESQNELLDNMNYKIEDVDLKMNKQNKEINKLLGKK
ncbi:PREDICTED: synaptosomal-associated protein 29 [Bactrocera latifrons]|uniref:Soluable nsf attachment protein 29 n=1 Tax=Bactrocera latifrons TaxID=174628 RepID=A0A0K8UCI6_BACLA|nr:PREDICTED: synaptosomal-associated protein 29 [Bactrocera latifrons]